MSWRRHAGATAVRVVLALVAVNAAIGIVVLIAGGLGETGGRILLTSLTLTASVMIGLACATGRSTPSLARVWPIGVAGAVAACALVIVAIWFEPDSETYAKAVGSAVATCVAVALVSLVGVPTLPGRFRWTFTAAAALAAVGWAMVLVGMWGEIDSSWYWRFFGAVAVALAAFLLAIPLLSRGSTLETRPAPGRDNGNVRFCPMCGRPLVGTLGEPTRCRACGSEFVVHH